MDCLCVCLSGCPFVRYIKLCLIIMKLGMCVCSTLVTCLHKSDFVLVQLERCLEIVFSEEAIFALEPRKPNRERSELFVNGHSGTQPLSIIFPTLYLLQVLCLQSRSCQLVQNGRTESNCPTLKSKRNHIKIALDIY